MIIIKYLLAIVIGGALGYLYYKKVGCPNGSCPITANPYVSTIYGSVLASLLASTF